jgi:hypothetical protein
MNKKGGKYMSKTIKLLDGAEGPLGINLENLLDKARKNFPDKELKDLVVIVGQCPHTNLDVSSSLLLSLIDE